LSSPDPRARRIRLLAGICLVSAAAPLSACGAATAAAGPSTATSQPTAAGVPADATTGRIAQVEFQRQCTIGAASFPDESGITADLDRRLAAAGLTHEQWKRWHDALVVSPDLVTQLRSVSAPGCTGS
jgi:hypothetical protein